MKGKKRLFGVLFVLSVFLIVLFVKNKEIENNTDDTSNQSIESISNVQEEIPEETPAENPDILYQTEEIEIYTLFPSSVVNTDADSEFVENLACVEFKNITGNYLKKCEIQIKTEEGETYSFLAEDIPAEMKVTAFEISNKTLEEEKTVADFTYSTEVDAADDLLSEKVVVSENGTEVTIKNMSGKDLADVVVACHCVMEDVIFGGTKYEYPIEILKDGETATINAAECYFGEARVVRVVANEK